MRPKDMSSARVGKPDLVLFVDQHNGCSLATSVTTIRCEGHERPLYYNAFGRLDFSDSSRVVALPISHATYARGNPNFDTSRLI